ncbi:MAG: aminopeptidase [Chlamydiales bacterium]|nr:aminopeptidase [Chlamydiales bacterium]
MQTHWIETSRTRKSADIAVIPFWQDKKKALPACPSQEFSQWVKLPVQAKDFQGKEGETLLLYKSSGKEKRILLLGLGKKTACLPDTLRKAYAAAVKAIRSKRLKTVHFFLPETPLIDEEIGTRAVFEGVLLADYAFVMLKSESLEEDLKHQIRSASFIGGGKHLAKELKKVGSIIDSVNLVRDLVNGNADEVTSDTLSLFAKGLQEQFPSIQTTILRKDALEKEGMGLMLAVNRAAAREPALILIEYCGDPSSKDWTADVFRSHEGKTVEIGNTDAEGRLVLADAFSYVQKHYKVARLIDMATLTGGIVVALGEEATGLFCNDEQLAKDLFRAGERTHERLWRMPLYPEHKEMLKSSIADLKNCAGRKASSCTAAVFLQQFIKNIPWAHLDIAGTAFLSETRGYNPTLATGVFSTEHLRFDRAWRYRIDGNPIRSKLDSPYPCAADQSAFCSRIACSVGNPKDGAGREVDNSSPRPFLHPLHAFLGDLHSYPNIELID